MNTVYIQWVVLDGVPGDLDDFRGTQIIFGKGDGILTTLEVAYLRGVDEESEEAYGKYAIGTWYFSGKFDDVLDVDGMGNPLKRSGNQGIYGFAEQMVHRESDDDAQGLALFVRTGIADTSVNQLGFYLGFGMAYTGLFPNRDEDQIGLAVATAFNGSDFKDAAILAGTPVDDSEVALELTYHAQIFPWLAVQPDFQLIVNPSMDPSVKNALVIGVRVELSF